MTFPPEAPSPSAPPRRRHRVLAVIGSIVGVLLVVAAVAAAVIHVPYVIISPGDATPLDAKVLAIPGHPAAKPGRLLFLTVQVSTQDPNLYRYLSATLNSDDDVQKKADVIGCASYAANARLNALLMRDSQDTAKEVALTRLGYPVPHLGDQVMVADLVCGGPSDHHLQVGDLITAVDGHPVATSADVRPLVQAHKPGDLVYVTVRRGAQTVEVAVRAGSTGGKAFLGIVSQTLGSWRFPITVNINTAAISGPSAGLAFTLAILNDLNVGDITGGHRVAATGTIEPDGSVGPVGGVAQKAIAAKQNGAVAFLVPAGEEKDARSHAGGLRVVAVHTVTDALSALQRLGGAPIQASPSSAAPAQ